MSKDADHYWGVLSATELPWGHSREAEESEDQTPEQRHKAMTCTRGHKGATPEAGAQSFRSCSRP